MAIVDGWVSWATRVPNVRQDKKYEAPNQGLGIAWHSQEGANLAPLVNIMNGNDRQTSYMFWLDFGGNLHQLAPVTASTWTSGNAWANTRFWPVELEGFWNMPIGNPQMRTAMRLIREWEDHTGKEATRWALPHTGWTPESALVHPSMVEHREIDTAAPRNAGNTQCPSERYAPLWERLAARDDRTGNPPGVVEHFDHGTIEAPIPDPYDHRFNKVLQDRFYLATIAADHLLKSSDEFDAVREALRDVSESLGDAVAAIQDSAMLMSLAWHPDASRVEQGAKFQREQRNE